MAFQAGKSAVVLFNQYDLSSYFNSIDLQASVELPETTTFGQSAKTRIPTLIDGQVSPKGFFAADTVNNNQADDVLRAALAASAATLSAAPYGTTIGNLARLATVLEAQYQVQSPVGGVVAVTADFRPASNALEFGVSLHDIATAETTSTNSTSVDNAASSSNGLVAHLHCTALAGTGGPTAVIKVQHSTNNSTWVDLITFTTVTTAVTSQRSTVTGTVNRYLRVISTIGGTNPSYTYAVTAARR